MSKFDYEVAVAFAPQSAEGSYDSTLDDITTSLVVANGLILGQDGVGVGGSGLSFGYGRKLTERSVISGTLSRPISEFLKAEVPVFSFAFPFCGNRADTTATPIDGDFEPFRGMDALLEGCGLVGAAWGTGVGWRYVYGSPAPISALIYINGHRLELLDCRNTLAIAYTPGEIPIATATIRVGSIKDHSAAAIPTTLTYGEQASVSGAKFQGVAFAWGQTRGPNSLLINCAPVISVIGDANATEGEVVEVDDRVTTISGTLFSDDTTNKIYDYEQIGADVVGDLDQLSFQNGASASGSDPALAHQIIAPLPEMQTSTFATLGTKAASEMSAILRGSSGNDELEVIFR
jgi:hypothetical protein